MPKSTFYKISDVKKQLIKSTGINLYSTRYFEEITVKMIVEAAQIPRGSFYAYFHDLEDYYFYVLQDLQEKRIRLIETVKSASRIDYFTFFFKLFETELESYQTDKPNLLLLHYYHYLQTAKSTSFRSLKQVQPKLHAEIEDLYPSIESHTTLTRVQHDLISEMIMNQYIQTYLKVHLTLTKEEALEQFQFKLKIIQEGLKQC